MSDAGSAAIRHFPEHREAIETLSARDPGFRSLCKDLREVEVALSRWKWSLSPAREERVVEYEALVAELVCEMRTILKGVAMGPHLTQRDRKQSR